MRNTKPLKKATVYAYIWLKRTPATIPHKHCTATTLANIEPETICNYYVINETIFNIIKNKNILKQHKFRLNYF